MESSMIIKCIFCDEAISDSDKRVLKDKGIAALTDHSKELKETLHYKDAIKKEEVLCHKNCYFHFVRREPDTEQNIKKSRKTRSTTPDKSFAFDKKCLFCDDELSEEFFAKEKKKAANRRTQVMYFKDNQNVRDNLYSIALTRDDYLGKKVESRLSTVPNLGVVSARAHEKCRLGFYKQPTVKSSCSKEKSEIDKGMDYVYDFLTNNTEQCQFSLNNLFKKYSEKDFSEISLRTKKRMLEERFGEDLMIYQSDFDLILCYKNTGSKILRDYFSEIQCSSETDKVEKRKKIVNAAANIIFEDIRSYKYHVDYYPSTSNFLETAESDIPKTLRMFLEKIILSTKTVKENWKDIITTVAHCIIKATRPRDFVSCVLLGLGTTIYKKIGSKDLINLLSSIGLSETYSEIFRFEGSGIHHMQNASFDIVSEFFSQYIYDNADHNTQTIDGFGSLHVMGGIQAFCPPVNTSIRTPFKRLSKNQLPTAEAISRFARVKIVPYYKSPNCGLSQLKFEDLNLLETDSICDLTPTHFLWLLNKIVIDEKTVGWNGFNELITKGLPYETYKLVCLPFINAPASDYSTVNTTLIETVRMSKKNNKTYSIMTMDQPLYHKAKDIIAAREDDLFKNVFVRLGGFHLLLSFMGSVGYLMRGSGLQDVLAEVYALKSTEKMLDGHAYSRAVRAHSLVHCCLTKMIFEQIDFSPEEKTLVINITKSILPTELPTLKDKLQLISDKFKNKINELRIRGPTSALWVQHYELLTLIKSYIESERSGNWHLQEKCVKAMIPIFHATGHLHYAKSAHMYVQDFQTLKEKLSEEDYKKFIDEGYFTIRRSSRFWSGLWSDMTIEQWLMRTFKLNEGLTRGRGVEESDLAKFILSMEFLIDVIDSFREFCQVKCDNSEQHVDDLRNVDSRPARIDKDNADLKKLYEWFQDHNPFPLSEFISCISTGHHGNSLVDCHKAYSKGLASYKEVIGKTITEVTIKKKNKVCTLMDSQLCLKVNKKNVYVEPLVLFQRISVLLNNTTKTGYNLKNFLKFELAPIPMSLFDKNGMRKTEKSILYGHFQPIEGNLINVNNSLFVIDGGFLLHKVVWTAGETFAETAQRYVNYVKRLYPQCLIVFDGYDNSTKDPERLRRNTFIVPNITIEENNKWKINQHKMLSNTYNKKQFIQLLKNAFQKAQIPFKQAHADADTLIVRTALDEAKKNTANNSNQKVAVVGEDIDLLILLTQLADDTNEVYFVKPEKRLQRGKRAETKYYNSKSYTSPSTKELICFIHALSGCDTTSAFFGQGKPKFIKLFQNNPALIEKAKIFYDATAHTQKLLDAGYSIISELYFPGVANNISLNDLRYICFHRKTANTTCPLSSLPPTCDSAKQHILRVYYQLQTWLGNMLIDPLNFGWKDTINGLFPIPIIADVIPKELVKMISCKCKKKCSGRCSCKKVSLKCTALCKYCDGQDCSNVEQRNIEDDSSDEEARNEEGSDYQTSTIASSSVDSPVNPSLSDENAEDMQIEPDVFPLINTEDNVESDVSYSVDTHENVEDSDTSSSSDESDNDEQEEIINPQKKRKIN